MQRIDEDAYGVWLFAPKGTITQRGDEEPIPMPHSFVKLVPHDAWHAAMWNSAGRYEVYVDVCTPATWDGEVVRMVDLDLDVVRYRSDGSVAVLDEDEFLEHRVAFGYPEHVVDRARSVAARLAIDLEQRHEPFGEVGSNRLIAATLAG